MLHRHVAGDMDPRFRGDDTKMGWKAMSNDIPLQGNWNYPTAIRFGAGDYPGLFCELLLRDRIFPVCSPAYARRHKLAQPSDLDGLTLLRSDGEPWSWWFPAAGIDADEPAHGLVFSDSSLLLQAAIDGQGVGLVRQSVGCQALAAGTLIRPFAASAETPSSYYFVCRKDRIDVPSIASFRRWLSARIADYSAGAEKLD